MFAIYDSCSHPRGIFSHEVFLNYWCVCIRVCVREYEHRRTAYGVCLLCSHSHSRSPQHLSYNYARSQMYANYDKYKLHILYSTRGIRMHCVGPITATVCWRIPKQRMRWKLSHIKYNQKLCWYAMWQARKKRSTNWQRLLTVLTADSGTHFFAHVLCIVFTKPFIEHPQPDDGRNSRKMDIINRNHKLHFHRITETCAFGPSIESNLIAICELNRNESILNFRYEITRQSLPVGGFGSSRSNRRQVIVSHTSRVCVSISERAYLISDKSS